MLIIRCPSSRNGTNLASDQATVKLNEMVSYYFNDTWAENADISIS